MRILQNMIEQIHFVFFCFCFVLFFLNPWSGTKLLMNVCHYVTMSVIQILLVTD